MKSKSGNRELAHENRKLNVAVLMGGIGAERDISVDSGRFVAGALKEAGLDVVTADVAPDNLDILEQGSVDVFFIALHGRFGEDGRLQQILEDKSLCYTGSGPAASRLAFDKMASKKAFAEAGVPVPPVLELSSRTNIRQLEGRLNRLGEKYVIKPVRQGSSVGVEIIDGSKRAFAAAQKCVSEFGDCMIEKFIPGRLVTVGILGGEPLPLIEVKTQRDFYDYQAKYHDDRTEYLFDTITNAAVEANIKAAGLDCFGALGCRDFARVDFILSDDAVAYALEANSIPGLTSHSLLPKAAEKAGLSMSNLCLRIVEAALTEKNRAACSR